MIFSRFRWSKDTVLELSQAREAWLYYRNTRLNLLTGWPENHPWPELEKKLRAISLEDNFASPVVCHFYYELGLILNGLGHSVKEDTPLLLWIEYKKVKKTSPRRPRLETLPLMTLERPSWSEYKEAFAHIRGQLLAGECYQVNLTYPFDYQTEDLLDPRDICDTFFAQKNLGAYAHATFWGDELILSNSPECLFHFEKGRLFTMPIKGTLKREKDWRKTWKKMLSSEKEEAELLMIADLLKNDLNRLAEPTAKVEKLRAPLLVPDLLHQYALISVNLPKGVTLLKTLEALFPGGSVTGAPKKRVMKIIQDVERFDRGTYCGSTLLMWKGKKVASINIRTAAVHTTERMWRYGAGGGITLLSNPVLEFQEMEAKVGSFLTLLRAPGYAKKPS